MNSPLRTFEMKKLCEALDTARRDRDLTWAGLMAEINKPFQGTPSIPISLGTVRRMEKQGAVTSAVALQILRWLHRIPESFLSGDEAALPECESLPEPGAGRILRFDTCALHAALDAERRKRGLTWKQLAQELPGSTANTLTNLANGPLIGFPGVMLLTQWLGCPAATFVRVCKQ
jgi:hypothetical protein